MDHSYAYNVDSSGLLFLSLFFTFCCSNVRYRPTLGCVYILERKKKALGKGRPSRQPWHTREREAFFSLLVFLLFRRCTLLHKNETTNVVGQK